MMQRITYVYQSPEGPTYQYDLDVVRDPVTHVVVDVRWRGGQSIFGLINDEKLEDIEAQADPEWAKHLAEMAAKLNSPEAVAARQRNREIERAKYEANMAKGT